MTTEHWIDRLSDYLDDDLAPADRRACETHLAACVPCADALADLERLTARARQLPDVPPRADLWTGIAARIQAPAQARPVPVTRRRVLLSIPQLAAAAALLLAVGAGTVWTLMPAPAPVGDPLAGAITAPAAIPVGTAYDAAVVRLETILRGGRDQLDPRTVRVLEESLLTIDRAILRAQSALEADPADPYLRQHVAETMQRKLDLLRQAAALTVSS